MNYTDNEELAKRMRSRKRRQRSDVFINFLTICLVLATLALAGLLMMIYSNPYIALNPFPPPTMPALVIYPTATSTFVYLPATWTPQPTATETPMPIFVSTTPEPATATSTVEAPVDQVYMFAIQGEPIGLNVDVFKPNTGCSWQGVAGLVKDMQDQQLINVGILIKGTYDGRTISEQTASGTHTEYGESGYEFQLGTTPIDSVGLLSIQLVDASGLPLSEPVIFDTYGTCDKNLIVINFKQIN